MRPSSILFRKEYGTKACPACCDLGDQKARTWTYRSLSLSLFVLAAWLLNNSILPLLSSMPPARIIRAIARGSVVEVVTSHRGTGIKEGQFLVIVHVGMDNKSAHVRIFDDKDEADTCAENALGGSNTEPAFQLEYTDMTRTVLSNVLGTAFEEVLVPLPSEYDGKSVEGIDLPILDGHGVFMGVERVDAVIREVDGALSFEFTHNGTEYNVPTNENACKEALGLNLPEIYPTVFLPSLLGVALSSHLKCMTASRALPANQLCAGELHDLLVAAGILSSGLLNPANEAAQLVGLACSLKQAAPKVVTSVGMLPAAIGALFLAEFARLAGVGASPDSGLGPGNRPPGSATGGTTSHPPSASWLDGIGESYVLARSLAALAKDAVTWREFLASSCELTCKPTSVAWAVSSGSRAQIGALERTLRSAQQTSISVRAVAPPLSASVSDLKGILFEIVEAQQTTDTGVTPGEGGVSDGDRRSRLYPGSIWSQFGSGPPTSITDTEMRERQCLRSDMEAVAAGAILEQLNDLNKMREANDPMLTEAVSAVTSVPLKRLITSGGDISSALAGMLDSRPLDMLMNLRSALERRVERVLFGDNEVPSERVTAVIRAIRTGKLGKLRLLHAIDVADCGTAEEPLKQLPSLGAAAMDTLSRALSRVCAITQLCHPSLGASAIIFFAKLQDKIARNRARGAEWSHLGTWLAKVLKMVARPQRAYSFGEGSTGGLNLRLAFFSDPSEFNDAMSDHIQEMVASHASTSQNASTGHKTQGGGGSESDKLKAANKRAAAAEQALGAARNGGNPAVKLAKKEKGGKGKKPREAKGAALLELDSNDTDLEQIDVGKRPAAGSEEMKAWNAEHLTDGKPQCWTHFNGGNCALGTKCRFAHVK